MLRNLLESWPYTYMLLVLILYVSFLFILEYHNHHFYILTGRGLQSSLIKWNHLGRHSKACISHSTATLGFDSGTRVLPGSLPSHASTLAAGQGSGGGRETGSCESAPGKTTCRRPVCVPV